jgi:hypothetical protein
MYAAYSNAVILSEGSRLHEVEGDPTILLCHSAACDASRKRRNLLLDDNAAYQPRFSSACGNLV